MKIRISDIDENGLHISTFREPEWLQNIPEIWSGDTSTHISSRIDVDLEVTKVLREVNVNGNVLFSIDSPCSRCLDIVNIELRPRIKLLLSPTDELMEDEDIDHETYSGDEFDLSNYLREQIAMALPVKVVCEEMCKGLCPSCGTNLNREICSCEDKWVDPRFSALKNLKV